MARFNHYIELKISFASEYFMYFLQIYFSKHEIDNRVILFENIGYSVWKIRSYISKIPFCRRKNLVCNSHELANLHLTVKFVHLYSFHNLPFISVYNAENFNAFLIYKMPVITKKCSIRPNRRTDLLIPTNFFV